MSENLIGIIITASVSLAINLLANWTARKKDAVERAKRDQKIEDSINELSARVDAHNGMIDIIVGIEKAIVRIDTKMESLHK